MYNALLIGKRIEVLAALDKTLIAKKGLVVDETKNLLTIETLNGSLLKLPKSIVTLGVFDSSDKSSITIEGSKLVGTPSDRIKG